MRGRKARDDAFDTEVPPSVYPPLAYWAVDQPLAGLKQGVVPRGRGARDGQLMPQQLKWVV